MKNLLRKLHIGGNNDDQVDAGRIIEGRSFHEGLGGGGGSHLVLRELSSEGHVTSSASSGSPSSLSTSPALWESKPSGLSTVWNAVKERVNANDKLSSNPITTAIGQLRHRLDSSSSGGDDSSTILGSKRMVTPPGSFKRPSTPDSMKRGSLLGSENQVALKGLESEEDYQVQMAIALSVLGDNQNITAGVDEKAQIEAAKRISLGISSAVGSSESDAISYRYWACNTVGYDEVITNGFYDLFGVGCSSHVLERMPALFELQKLPVSDTLNIEVVLVDREHDPKLVALEEHAAELAACAGMEDVDGSFRTSLARKIAALVAERMGGPVISETDMLLRWQKSIWDDKHASQNVVLSLGSLHIGLTRHRALLFKVLADRVGIPCQLLKGRHYPGVEEEGAVNLIKVDHNRELIIDLMGAPGALLPSDRTVTNSPETDFSLESTRMGPEPEHSSSFVSSIQSSPSGSTHSIQSDTGNHSKDMKDPSHQIGMTPYAKLDNRHHSEPVELQGLDMKPVRYVPSNRMSHFRSPSWTEGIGLPGGRQMNEKDVSQLVIDAAKEDPQLLQKLHDVLLESGVIQDKSQKQLQSQVMEDKMLEDDKRRVQEKIIALPAHLSKKKSSTVLGRPPIGTFKPTQPLTEEGLSSAERLLRLDSVEGLGDRRPLESPPVDIFSPLALLPLVSPATVHAALPLALPLPVASGSPGQVEDSGGNPHTDYVRHVPVAAAAAAAATAAVVASTMVAAAARGEGAGDPKMEVPIAAAATATAAVVAATSAVAGRVIDGDESSTVNSSYQPCSGQREMNAEEIQKEVTGHKLRHSDDRRSEPDGSTLGNSYKPFGMSGDGLDGEVSAEEERNSENVSGNVRKRYDAVLADVAEWEIPWEDVVIGERIGLGSYGEVYRGDWHGSEVAVKKFLDQDLSGYALEEFRSEVRIMRRLRHPNVVLFMGAITRPPHLSIVTEFLPRGSLYRLIHRPNSQLDERRRLRMALDVAKGMNYLHSGNPVIVHRDLKSPNLLVDKNWVVKVCDFGLSRMKHNTFLSSKSTAGTPEWMAPEMLRNEPSNEKCDVYSFGVILWELATLQQPWAGLNPMQVVGAVGFQYRRLDIPPEMDPSLARIIQDCWHDNPNLRPSFSQLMAALRPLQRPLSAAQQSDNRQSQTSQGSTIQSRLEEHCLEGPSA